MRRGSQGRGRLQGPYPATHASLGRAQDRYVSLDGGNLEPYTQWVDAATSLKAAVDLANKTPGYTVWVSNGQYDITGVITVQNTKVRGFTQVPADTVINGGGATRYPLFTPRSCRRAAGCRDCFQWLYDDGQYRPRRAY